MGLNHILHIVRGRNLPGQGGGLGMPAGQQVRHGGGISYGYQWKLSERWNLETSLGLGYARLSYDKFPYEKCSKKIGEEKKNYFGPTKVALSIIYIIK